MTASQYFHTIRHLRPVQIWGRMLTRLPPGKADTSQAPPLRAYSGMWCKPVSKPQTLRGRWRVVFLNKEGDIATRAHWNDPAKPKLWLYNLHYFDDLSASGDGEHAKLQSQLVSRWINENPPGHGNGWEPYPISLRVVNWIKWGLSGATLEPSWRDSLATQVRWLTQHLEWHLFGNHLLANAKALVMAGLYFDGPEAEQWLARGLSIYTRELPEQILSDGGHFELSPMYQAIILEDLLDILNAAQVYGYEDRGLAAQLPEVIARMRAWLAVMTHPDGGLAFFNDCAFGISASPDALDSYASRLGLAPIPDPGEGLYHLAASGYVRINQGEAAAILDIASIGPDYLPGHAHADSLSFELSVRGERIIVNTGTSTYESSPQRHLERSTSSHSTVEINGENSSEVWGAFRVARRARILRSAISTEAGRHTVTATHDGYRRLPGQPLHTRIWRMSNRSLEITDTVCGSATPALARFHATSGTQIAFEQSAQRGTFTSSIGTLISWRSSEPARLTASEWRPEFGIRKPSHCLAIPFEGGPLVTTIEWP